MNDKPMGDLEKGDMLLSENPEMSPYVYYLRDIAFSLREIMHSLEAIKWK